MLWYLLAKKANTFHFKNTIRMEVASSRPDHLPTLSVAKTSKLSRQNSSNTTSWRLMRRANNNNFKNTKFPTPKHKSYVMTESYIFKHCAINIPSIWRALEKRVAMHPCCTGTVNSGLIILGYPGSILDKLHAMQEIIL